MAKRKSSETKKSEQKVDHQTAGPRGSQRTARHLHHSESNLQRPTPNSHLVRVRYAETDQAGMAHHSSYFPWFEEGRVELLRRLGKPYQELEADGVHFPVRETFCRYWAPAFFDEILVIETSIEEIGGASVQFAYRITSQAEGGLIAEGLTLHACVDDNGKVKRLPLEIKKALLS